MGRPLLIHPVGPTETRKAPRRRQGHSMEVFDLASPMLCIGGPLPQRREPGY